MKTNIVLTGMSGSGKTTVGKLLAKNLDMAFVDTDEIIEQEENRKIKDIFETDGEKFFRDLETRCAKKVSYEENTVISTGGGMILREENMNYLKKSSITVYLKRSVESIKTTMDASNRPLLSDGLSKLYEMEKVRTPIYEKYADIIVVNEGTPEEAIEKITEYLNSI